MKISLFPEKIPRWAWLILCICILLFFLGMTLGLLVSREYNNWGTTLFMCICSLFAGGALGVLIEHTNVCPKERDNDYPRP